MEHGKIRITAGQYEGKDATVYSKKKIIWLEINSLFSSTKTNLSEELASVKYAQAAETSTKRVLARTALAGLAGTMRSQGTAWAILGAASSLGTKTNKHYISLRLKNGSVISGQTTPEVAKVLADISPDLSDNAVHKLLQDQEKQKRFLDDAPRTIHEVKDNIDELTKKILEIEPLRDKGERFDIREDANKKYAKLRSELEGQEALYQLLNTRIQADKKYGSVELYEKASAKLDKQISKLEKRGKYLGLKFFGSVFVLLIGGLSSNAFFICFGIVATLRAAYLIKTRRKNQERLSLLYAEKENILIP